MSTQGVRESLIRGYRRRKAVLNIDLNKVPPCEDWDQEGTSTQAVPAEVVVNQQPQPLPFPTIDVEAIEDEVVESSARAFAEARSKARRNRGRVDVIVVDSAHVNNARIKRRREPLNQEIIYGDLYINLESNSDSMRETEKSKIIPPPPPEPTFSCPICMGPLVHEMSTKCGHIFCKECIHAAIAAQNKCPSCRKKVTKKELIRVFLPTTRSL